MGKHTPGPWILSEYEVVRYGDTKPKKICEITCSNNNKIICEIPDYAYHAEYAESDSADASLIAASPDLLEALELCLNAVCLAGWSDDYCAVQARAAIARAKGEQQ